MNKADTIKVYREDAAACFAEALHYAEVLRFLPPGDTSRRIHERNLDMALEDACAQEREAAKLEETLR